MKNLSCPNCYRGPVESFYAVQNTPVNSMIQVFDLQQAHEFPLGRICLGSCERCGFIFNTVFDPLLAEYSELYESTQRHSETFSKFNEALADQLIDKHGLFNKRIIEIGCGEGEFLHMLCRKGRNTGVGFDPAYSGGDVDMSDNIDVSFVQDFFSESYRHYQAEYYVCKMTLEHIADVGRFINMLSSTIVGKEAKVFFQVPNFEKSLHEGAFWDVYYEHCSYFTPASLAACFEKNGFVIIDQWTDFEDQYLMIEAVPSGTTGSEGNPEPLAPSENSGLISLFRSSTDRLRKAWSKRLLSDKQSGLETVIWGASSKGVSFLTTLETRGVIRFAVDINPKKRGMFIPGSAQRIVGPGDLRDIRPDAVIVMNPVYTREIDAMVTKMDLAPAILTVENPEV